MESQQPNNFLSLPGTAEGSTSGVYYSGTTFRIDDQISVFYVKRGLAARIVLNFNVTTSITNPKIPQLLPLHSRWSLLSNMAFITLSEFRLQNMSHLIMGDNSHGTAHWHLLCRHQWAQVPHNKIQLLHWFNNHLRRPRMEFTHYSNKSNRRSFLKPLNVEALVVIALK